MVEMLVKACEEREYEPRKMDRIFARLLSKLIPQQRGAVQENQSIFKL